MVRLRNVECANCKKPFYKNKWHIQENLELGHNFYCSKFCFSEYRKTGKELVCENNLCKKKFYRAKGEISAHNYCSSSCAATVNNYRFPKWPTRYCKICTKVVKREGTSYCSIACGKEGRFKYTKEEIIELIKNYYAEFGRVPAKREILDISHKAVNIFGTWNNAITAAGFTPNRSHSQRMYRRVNAKALDGHLCDSVSEALIDNWLTKHNIPHARNVSYPGTKYLTDWALGKNIFLEYFGLAKDSPRYDRTIKRKRNFCRRNSLKLMAIYPKDIYPKILLDNKLKELILRGNRV